MDLRLWYGDACQGVMYGIAVMSISPGVDHQSVRPVKIGVLYPVNDCSLMVALKYFYADAAFLSLFGDQIQEIIIILISIDILFPDPRL